MDAYNVHDSVSLVVDPTVINSPETGLVLADRWSS